MSNVEEIQFRIDPRDWLTEDPTFIPPENHKFWYINHPSYSAIVSIVGDGVNLFSDLEVERSYWQELTTFIDSVDKIDDLQDATTESGARYLVLGEQEKGDGFYGLYTWDESSTETDDGINIIQVSGVATGRFLLSYNKARRFRRRSNSGLASMLYNHQFGGTSEHYLSKNAIVISGDSITQGANAGYYMDNGWAYKVRRALMDAYDSKSYGYLSVSDKDGYITEPTGAYRWYEPSTDGTLRENDDAPNSIGGTEVELGTGEFVKFQFNRQDKYSKVFIPNQRKIRIVFNDSTGSVRITADGINYSLDQVVATSGTDISAYINLPNSWDGTVTITQESGTPVINGIVLLYSEDDYAIHQIYNGGRALNDISQDTLSKIITGADLYIHALGVNDYFKSTGETTYNTKIDQVISILEASQQTKLIVMDFVWLVNKIHYTREGLRRLNASVKNESSIIDCPDRISNGQEELSIDDLKSAEIKFLSSDGVHPFLNGHTQIAQWCLAELGIDFAQQFEEKSASERETVIQDAKLIGYEFGDIDLGKLIIGWTSDGNNSIVYTESSGTLVTGYIFAGYIETKIPITENQFYYIEWDIENIDSTGTISLGTRSLNALGQEIWEQDSAGGLAGNLPISGYSIPTSTRETIGFYVGGRNGTSGTDASKFEPNAAFFNLAAVLGNGDTTGEMVIWNVRVTAVHEKPINYELLSGSYLNDWTTITDEIYITKDNIDNIVSFHGLLTGGVGSTSGSAVYIIPSEYRPSVQLEFHTIDVNGDLLRIRIETGGYIRVYGTGTSGWNDNVNFSMISYKI